VCFEWELGGLEAVPVSKSDISFKSLEMEEVRKSVAREEESREAAETARARIQRELAELHEKLDEEVILRTNAERMRKKLEADYEEAKEQLDVESSLRAKAERALKTDAKGSKDLQQAKADADRLKQRVSQLEKMEADYKKLQARLAEEEDGRRAAEVDRKKAQTELTETRSDVNYYKQQVDKLRADLENEKEAKDDLSQSLAAILNLSSGNTGRTTTRPKKSED